MHHWEWHDFTDKTEPEEVDEFDPHRLALNAAKEQYITREFWVGSFREGVEYTVGLLRIRSHAMLECIVGAQSQQERKLILPDSGGWLVNFNLSAAGRNYDRVALTHRAKKDLFSAVSCTIYDHYNLTKAGLYCWYAARPELMSLYDRALGFKSKARSRQKFIPGAVNVNGLGQVRRGYAIITRYY